MYTERVALARPTLAARDEWRYTNDQTLTASPFRPPLYHEQKNLPSAVSPRFPLHFRRDGQRHDLAIGAAESGP